MLFGGGAKKLPADELGPCDGVMLRSGFGSDHARQKFRVATLDGPKSFRILPHPWTTPSRFGREGNGTLPKEKQVWSQSSLSRHTESPSDPYDK